MRRAFKDAVVSATAVGTVLFALVAVDTRVRDQISLRFVDGHPTVQVIDASVAAHDWTSIVYQAARQQSIEHAPLMIFVLSATVLLLFMFRTN